MLFFQILSFKNFCSALFSHQLFSFLFFSFKQTGFPINSCDIVGLLESREGDFFYYPLCQCCEQCRLPKFANCIKSHHPYVCASRAHTCICKCREKHLRVLERSKNSRSRSIEVQRFKGPRICEKKTCDSRSKQCCVENQCVMMNV